MATAKRTRGKPAVKRKGLPAKGKPARAGAAKKKSGRAHPGKSTPRSASRNHNETRKKTKGKVPNADSVLKDLLGGSGEKFRSAVERLLKHHLAQQGEVLERLDHLTALLSSASAIDQNRPAEGRPAPPPETREQLHTNPRPDEQTVRESVTKSEATDPDPQSTNSACEIPTLLKKVLDAGKARPKCRPIEYLIQMKAAGAIQGTSSRFKRTTFLKSDGVLADARGSKACQDLLLDFDLISPYKKTPYTKKTLAKRTKSQREFRIEGTQLTEKGLSVLRLRETGLS
jgi:hypothetical protein